MILTPKIEKSPYRGRGDTPLPPLGRFAPSGLVAPLPRIFPYKLETTPPPHFWRPVYATGRAPCAPPHFWRPVYATGRAPCVPPPP